MRPDLRLATPPPDQRLNEAAHVDCGMSPFTCAPLLSRAPLSGAGSDLGPSRWVFDGRLNHMPIENLGGSVKGLVLVGALTVNIACSSPTDVIGGNLLARVTPPTVILTNQTSAPVYFFAIEGRLAIRANWGPCTDPSRCTAIAPAASADLPFDQIAGYDATAQTAIVYWWHLIPGGATGFHPDSVRAVGFQF